MTIEICSNLRNNMNPRVTHKQRKSLVTGFKILLSIKLSIILSYYYHSRRRQERAKWALRVSDGDVREVRTDRERETRSGRTVVLGSFPPSLRPVILPSRRSGGSEEPSDRREERTRAWGTERRRDERDGGKGRKRGRHSDTSPRQSSVPCLAWRCHQNPFVGALRIQEPVILGEPQIKG